MAWVVGLVWGIAVLFGLAVLGLCAWDLAGKVRRVRTDVARLLIEQDRLSELQTQVADARRRLPSVRGIAGR